MKKGGGKSQPIGRRVHFVLWQTQVSGSDVFHREKFDFLEPYDLSGHVDFSMGYVTPVELFPVEHIQDFDLSVVDRVGKIIDVCPLDIGLPLLKIEFLDEILLTFAHIDGFGVESGEGRGKVHFGDGFRFFGCVDDDEVIRADTPEAHPVRRVGVRRPEPFLLGMMEELFFFEKFEDFANFDVSEIFSVAEGKLKGRTFDMTDKDGEIVGIEERSLGIFGEEVVWMIDDELVERRARSH